MVDETNLRERIREIFDFVRDAVIINGQEPTFNVLDPTTNQSQTYN